MAYIIPFVPLAMLLALALITRKMAESMIAACAVGAGYTLCFYADAVFMTTASTGVANLTIIKTVMPYAVSMTIISAVAYVALGFMI